MLGVPAPIHGGSPFLFPCVMISVAFMGRTGTCEKVSEENIFLSFERMILKADRRFKEPYKCGSLN